MGQTFRKRLGRLILMLLLGFAAMFLFRLAYGFTKTVYQGTIQNLSTQNNFINRRNIASFKYQQKDAVQSTVAVDQKYERIADITTKSAEFDREEQEIKDQIEKYESLIQFEQKSGKVGNRKLTLSIGVPPANFDEFYNNAINIGKVESMQITKTDKTNEYKELNARKTTLEKYRNSLVELKSKGVKIEELLQLESKILEIEQQLQGLGVSLGDFDEENEFCTVQFTLKEGKEVKISFMHRVKVALEWTINFYLKVIAILFFISGFAFLLLKVIEKFQLLERIVDKNE